ncbi:unnamed protein product [Discula destructiva]
MDHAPPNPPSSPSSFSLDEQEWEIVSCHDSPSKTTKNTASSPSFQPPAAPATPEPIMGWKDDYLNALLEAERSNPVSFDLVEACSHLNDRIATLEAEKALHEHEQHQQSQPTTPSSNKTRSPPTAAQPQDTSPLHARTRADLALTLSQKAHLESRLRATTHDRDRLLSISKAQQQTIGALGAERDGLARKVRDQASELRGKNELLQRVQDDLVALEIERNMAEKAKARLTKENKELVERWMVRMASEANAMNKRNEGAEGSA